MVDNPSTVPSGGELAPEEGENVAEESQAPESSPEEKLLTEINQATGRNYANLQEAIKGIKETYSFVGSEVIAELRKKAQEYDKLKRQTLPPEEKAQEFYKKVDRMEFLLKYPEAESVVGLVAAIAKDKGMSYAEAYESTPEGKRLQKIVEQEKKEKEAAQPEHLVPGQRLGPGEISISLEEFSRLPLEEQRKIVSKLPGWSEKLPRGHFSSTRRSG